MDIHTYVTNVFSWRDHRYQYREMGNEVTYRHRLVSTPGLCLTIAALAL